MHRGWTDGGTAVTSKFHERWDNLQPSAVIACSPMATLGFAPSDWKPCPVITNGVFGCLAIDAGGSDARIGLEINRIEADGKLGVVFDTVAMAPAFERVLQRLIGGAQQAA